MGPCRQLAAAYTGQHKHRRNTDIHVSSGIQPKIPAFEQAKTFHALHRTSTVMGPQNAKYNNHYHNNN
jgi:hypothetical protein